MPYKPDPRFSAEEILVRFAYVALFKAYVEEISAIPAQYYSLDVLLARGHAVVDNGWVSFTADGLRYWSAEVVKMWSTNQTMSHAHRAVLEGRKPQMGHGQK